MYTSYIGKKFLKLYNEKKNLNFTGKIFFDEVLFPLFFNDDRHFMHVHGSTFFQKVSEKDIREGQNKHTFRLSRLHRDVNEKKISGSNYVAYAAETPNAVSSGQVSSIQKEIDEEEIYCSWIGQALSLGVEERFCLLLSEEDILWYIFEGWFFYRKYLTQTTHVKDKEIEFWNTVWYLNILNNDFEISSSPNIETDTSVGETRIRKIGWSNLIYSLCQHLPNQEIVAYCYKLDKTNTTLGFIKIYLHEITEMYEFRDKIFVDKTESILSDKEIMQLGTFYNFKSACQLGTIGLKAMEPAKLREFMSKGSVMYAQGKDFKFNSEESYQYYQLYKIWITAMLNKTDLLHLAEKIAGALLKFEDEGDRGKKIHDTISAEIRKSKSIVEFTDKISDLLLKSNTDKTLFKNVVEEVLKMPVDNFPLFITLIRFEYNYQKK